MNEETALDSSRRIPGLDLLRALAITMVLANHTIPFFSTLPPSQRFRWLEGGWLGVDLFFALSGFLIGCIILQIGAGMGEPRIVVGFWLGRWFRTLPAYYLFLGINVVLHRLYFNWPFSSSAELIPYFLFTQNLVSRQPTFFVESWSLCVEEWFYLLVPLLLLFFFRARRSVIFSFSSACVIMLVAPFVLRCLNLDAMDRVHGAADVVVYRLDAIGFGMVAALGLSVFPKLFRAWRHALLVVGILLVASCYAFVCDNIDLRGSWFARVLLDALIPMGFALMIPWAATCFSLGGGWFERGTAAVARWSYSLYLVNVPLVVVVYFFIQPRMNGYAGVAEMLGWYSVGCLLIAAFMWRFVEWPIMRSRRRIRWYRESCRLRSAGVIATSFTPAVAHAEGKIRKKTYLN